MSWVLTLYQLQHVCVIFTTFRIVSLSLYFIINKQITSLIRTNLNFHASCSVEQQSDKSSLFFMDKINYFKVKITMLQKSKNCNAFTRMFLDKIKIRGNIKRYCAVVADAVCRLLTWFVLATATALTRYLVTHIEKHSIEIRLSWQVLNKLFTYH